MRIAVTGGSGFVGEHVLAELNACGQQYVATCRSSSTRPLNRPTMRCVEWDIAEPSDGAFEKLGRPEVLIHLAWSGLPNYLSTHHVEDELPKQLRFLSGMVHQGLKSLVVAGTCFEYGMQTGPISASAPRHPENPYGIAKDQLFRELTALSERVPFDLTWARATVAQCSDTGTACFVKQLGSAPVFGPGPYPARLRHGYPWNEPDKWPEDLRVQEFPA